MEQKTAELEKAIIKHVLHHRRFLFKICPFSAKLFEALRRWNRMLMNPELARRCNIFIAVDQSLIWKGGVGVIVRAVLSKWKIQVQLLREKPSSDSDSNSKFQGPSCSEQEQPRSFEHRFEEEQKHDPGAKAKEVEVMSSKNGSSRHVSKTSDAKVSASSKKSSTGSSNHRESTSASTPKASSKKSSSTGSSNHRESTSASTPKASSKKSSIDSSNHRESSGISIPNASSKKSSTNSSNHRESTGTGASTSKAPTKSSSSGSGSRHGESSKSGVTNSKPSKRPRDASSESSSRKKSKKLSRDVASTGFDATVASFDEVLGILDSTTTSVKKKKQNPPLAKKQNHSNAAEKLKSAPSSSASRASDKNTTKSRSSPLFSLDITSAPPAPIIPDNVFFPLPEIQPNYKPIRYNLPEVPAVRPRTPSAEVNKDSFMSSKHNRTQVFSGRKQGLTEVPRLEESCLKILEENIDYVTYTGGVPYSIMESVLKKITAQQLYNIEYYNPYLMEDTGPLWEKICERVFRGKKPDEYESWRDLYIRLMDERDARLKRITANISASVAKTLPVRQTKLAYVDAPVKPPRDVFRRQVKNGTAAETNRTVSNKSAPPSLKQRLAKPPPGSETISAPAAASSGAAGPSSHQKPAVKKVAPLMKKTLQLMKSNYRR